MKREARNAFGQFFNMLAVGMSAAENLFEAVGQTSGVARDVATGQRHYSQAYEEISEIKALGRVTKQRQKLYNKYSHLDIWDDQERKQFEAANKQPVTPKPVKKTTVRKRAARRVHAAE